MHVDPGKILDNLKAQYDRFHRINRRQWTDVDDQRGQARNDGAQQPAIIIKRAAATRGAIIDLGHIGHRGPQTSIGAVMLRPQRQ